MTGGLPWHIPLVTTSLTAKTRSSTSEWSRSVALATSTTWRRAAAGSGLTASTAGGAASSGSTLGCRSARNRAGSSNPALSRCAPSAVTV
jgi:hypothetical protein